MRVLRSPYRPVVHALLLLCAAGAAGAQQRAMTVVDLINVPSVSDPQISSDGAFVVYTRSAADWKANKTVAHLWRVKTDGTESLQLTNGDDGERGARWSPDGATVAFLAKRGGAEHTQVYLIRSAGGEAQVLTTHATDVSDLAWSPDGRWIYFVAADEKSDTEKAREEVKDNVYAFDESYQHRHLWRVPVAGGDEERITTGEFTVRGYEVSRDGALIVHHRAPSPRLDDGQLSEVWIMGATGDGARRLTENGIGESGAELSPDNARVLFVANANAEFEFYYNDKLFLVPAAGGRPEVLLPEFPHEIQRATWAADGRAIFVLANTGVRQQLFRFDVPGGRVTQLTDGDHTVRSWTYAPRAGRHVFTVSSPTNAGDIWMLSDRGRGQPARVTKIFDYLARDFRLPRVEAVQWAGEDGVSVEGLLFYPLDYRPGERYPLVVQTHGGPAASDKYSWEGSGDYPQVLTAMGYMVLKPNYRGSTGYGDEFLRDMVGGYFDQAHKDVMAGVDHLIGRGMVDGERMAKMGWSAGGHMTNKIITYPDRFKAAASGAGAANWISMYAQSDTRVYRTPWFGGTPWQRDAPLDQYWADSPLRDAWKVTTPTIFLVGEDDRRVPMPQSVEMYRALTANGVPTHLYVAPRQGHGWRELQQRLFKANVEIAWFEQWVRGRDYVWERSPVHPPEGGQRAATGAR